VLRFDVLRWVLVPAIALHNFEEWLTFRDYRGMSAPLSQLLGMKATQPDWPATQFALMLVTLLPAAMIISCSIGRQSARKDWAICWISGIFFANIFVPHIPATIAAGGYSPGIVTAILVNLPLSLLIFRAVRREGRLSVAQLTLAMVAGLTTLPLAIAVAYFVAKALL
jgi:hypothetical protein